MTLDKNIKNAIKYISSPEGKREIEETVRLAKEGARQIRESYRTKPEQLQKTIHPYYNGRRF